MKQVMILSRDESYSVLTRVACKKERAHEEAPVWDKGPGTMSQGAFRVFGIGLFKILNSQTVDEPENPRLLCGNRFRVEPEIFGCNPKTVHFA